MDLSLSNSSNGSTLTRPTSMSPHPNDRDNSRRTSSSISTQMTIRGMRRLERRMNMEEHHYRAAKAAATRNLNPPVDLRMLDYVSGYDDNLMCAICRCPFVDPVILTECDHCFCRDCIRQTWAGNMYSPLGPRGDCPSCRTPAKLGSRGATSKILVNLVDDLAVKCPKSEEGCTATVKRGEVQDHVSLYCQYAQVECPEEGCDRPVVRKQILQYNKCLHYGVSCLDCHQDMPVAELEAHWKLKCPDRQVTCEQCKQDVFYRELTNHKAEDCPASTIPCPGKSLGCITQSNRTEASNHAQTCPLAKMAPIFAAQTQRLDEQATAQKLMTKELDLLRSGFSHIQDLLHPTSTDLSPDISSADETRIPLLQAHHQSNTSYHQADQAFPFPIPLTSTENPQSSPYTSPHHHLLSLHESLRDEVSRVTTALSDLDGRQSMERLNDNLRIRDEMAYLGARVEGLGRQVCWLTNAQLMRRQGQSGGGGGGSGEGGEGSAGAGVEAAVSAVGAAVNGIRGAMGGGEGSAGAGRTAPGMRRGASEEGRTKL